MNFASVTSRYKERVPTHNGAQFSSNNSNVLYPASYSDTGYLQMALGAYLTPSASGYKSVDPYFLSQGNVIHITERTIIFTFHRENYHHFR